MANLGEHRVSYFRFRSVFFGLSQLQLKNWSYKMYPKRILSANELAASLLSYWGYKAKITNKQR